MTTDGPFHFTDDRPAGDDSTLVVRIPANINRKRKMLALYSGQLRFPAYFGWNWDAFEECLRDLSWLDGVRQGIVAHRDLPVAESPEQQEIYLSILRDRFGIDQGPRVTVTFPRSAQAMVVRTLEHYDAQS